MKAIVSTGALMAHGLVEATGRAHSVTTKRWMTASCFAAGYNRVYDSLEPEVNLDHVEEVMQRHFGADGIRKKWCAAGKSIERLASIFAAHEGPRNFEDLRTNRNVPVFVPAFTDSELGIDLALHQRLRKKAGRSRCDSIRIEDFEHYATTMLATKRMGIFTIGGGVPRNWAQQFGVYAELLARRGYEKLPLKRYNYGVRICPEPVNWGGLSGQHLHGSCVLGKVRAAGGRRASLRKCWTMRRWRCR